MCEDSGGKSAYSLGLLIILFASLWLGCGSDDEQENEGTPDRIVGNDMAEMVLIPAGEFEMGDPFNEGTTYERPVHTVFLDDFYIDVYEVTNAMYAKFLNAMGKHVGDTGHIWLDMGDGDEMIEWVGGQYQPKAGFEEYAVVEVSWYGASAYAQWAGKRLPTEAEWEKAARGGQVEERYPWGDDDPDGSQCNFADKHTSYSWSDQNADDGYQKTAPVGVYPPNGYELYDIAGNVWEWCVDELDVEFYENSPKENPVSGGLTLFMPNNFTTVTERRILRGGSWHSTPEILRVAYRNSNEPAVTLSYVGFRCVVPVDP